MSERASAAIGGYFGLELPAAKAWHDTATAVNSGRNALQYLLRAGLPRKIYLPHFTCAAVADVVRGMGIAIAHYAIDEALEPVFDYNQVAGDEVFLYTNYFGLKDRYVQTLAARGCDCLVDNAQSFFSPQVGALRTFYSARKFFGVPDGGYAYGGGVQPLEPDYASARAAHLLVRHDESAQAGYAGYLASEAALAEQPLKAMSALSQRIMASIDYHAVAAARRRNFQQLHDALGGSNALPIDEDSERVALTYPYLGKDPALKSRLLAQYIFTASYWPDIAHTIDAGSVEHRYSTQLVHLPIDQRYGDSEMRRILEVVLA
jgi:hypothetical protein